MYDKIVYFWNIVQYIIWNHEINMFKSFHYLMYMSVFKILPKKLAQKAENNWQKGWIFMADPQVGVAKNIGDKHKGLLVFSHACYLAWPLVGVFPRFSNKFIIILCFLVPTCIAIFIDEKLTYPENEQVAFFEKCNQRPKMWKRKWGYIVFGYFIFVFMTGFVGGIFVMLFINHNLYFW